MNEEEPDAYLSDMRNGIQQRRNNMVAVQHIQYNIGEMNVIFPHCATLRFRGEPFHCCHNGKVTGSTRLMIMHKLYCTAKFLCVVF